MHVKGALHMHSTLSRDGTLPLSELAAWYAQRGYSFIAVTEHSEDMNSDKVAVLRKQSAENSTERFCVIPGIEFSNPGDIHIPGIGVPELLDGIGPVQIIEQIHRRGGFAILAHPRRIGWRVPEEILQTVDAVEIWNIAYDGKYLPSLGSLGEFRRAKAANPQLLAIAGHDFHRAKAFYDLGIEMEVADLTREAVLANLRRGAYLITSRFFRADAQGRTSWANAASLQVLSPALRALRMARSLILRGSL